MWGKEAEVKATDRGWRWRRGWGWEGDEEEGSRDTDEMQLTELSMDVIPGLRELLYVLQ